MEALRIDGVCVDFDGFKAVDNFSMSVAEGELRVLLGANGAGKTTTLKAISNLLRAERGDVTKGSILLRGEEIQKMTAHDLVRRGVIQVMEAATVSST